MTIINTEPKIIVSYNPITRDDIEKVILVDNNDVDYQLFLEKLSKKDNSIPEKYIQLYTKYKQEFDKYFEIYNLLLKVSHIQVNFTRNCSTCYYCKKEGAQYGTGFVCWDNWTIRGRPKKVNLYSNCQDHQTKYDANASIILLDQHFEVIKKIDTSFYLAKDIESSWSKKEISLEERCVKAAYDLAYLKEIIQSKMLPHFNRSVLTNILIYFYKQNLKKVQIGKEALQYEATIGEILTRFELPMLPKIFKIYYKDSYFPFFKRMDYLTKLDSTYYVLEVFTFWRNHKEKVQQIKDYVHLLKQTGITDNIQPLLVEKDAYLFEHEPKEKVLEEIPLLNEKTLIDFFLMKGGF